MSTVFIGLGGTGCNVIKLFTERVKASTSLYHELVDKSQIALWSIDADEIKYTPGFDSFWVRSEVSVKYAEKVENNDYQKDRFFRDWFDPKWRTFGHINGAESPGAGQIKLNGRMALYHNIEMIRTDLQKIMGMAHISKDDRYYVITSLFGGTGSGMYFDLVYLLQNEGIPPSEIRSFILDPSVLEVIDPRKTNNYSWIASYASYLEMDFWQSNSNERNRSLQYSMHYNDNLIIESSKYLSKPIFIFGGKDQNGRSLKGENTAKLFNNYQELVANVLFEMSFTKEFKQYTGKNTIDNIEENLVNSHSSMFGSIGLTYLVFPKKKLANYLTYKYLNNDFRRKFNNREVSQEDKETTAHTLLKELEYLQNELNQITTQIESLGEYKSWKEQLEDFKNTVERSKKKESLPRRPASVESDNVKKRLDQFIKEKLVSVKLAGNISSYSELLGTRFIPGLIKSNTSLPDIIDILDLIKIILQKEDRKAKEVYAQSIEQLTTKNYIENYPKIYSTFRSSKNTFFKKNFDESKAGFLRVFNSYRNLMDHKYKLDVLTYIYQQLQIETNKWLVVLDYLNQRINNSIYIKTPDRDHTLRNSPFVFDKEKSANQLLYELNIGDNIRFMGSDIIENIYSELSSEDENSNSVLKMFLNGDKETAGFADLLTTTHSQLNTEGEKGLNDSHFVQDCENKFQRIIDKYILAKIYNKVVAIQLQDVITWQFQDIFNYMKGLKDNYKQNPEEYNIAEGQFSAMFGDKSYELLNDLGKKSVNKNKWIEEAIVLFIANVANEVEPLWEPKAGQKPLFENQVIVHHPQEFHLTIKTSGNDIFVTQATNAYNDRIAILNFSHSMPLSELNFVSDDLVLLYENHKKAKLGPEGSKINPVHSDFRFYNQYSWDLFKSQSEMQTSLFTVEFSLGFVISNNGQSVIARNKTGYFYNPSDKYPGKKKIKLGTSYHKSFMNMLGDRKISDDLIYQIRENLNKQIYSFSSDIEKSEFIKNLLNKAVQNIETLQPPKVLNSDAYELWEMTHKTLREIFEQINETNYLKLLNIE